MKSGDKLPSSRSFAIELGVSRVTITAVLDQLIAEGYLEGKRGSGVFVSSDIPDVPFAVVKDDRIAVSIPPVEERVKPFAMASPELVQFPHREWVRLFDTVWRNPSKALLTGVDPLGWEALRVAIAGHLRVWRGIHCAASQIVVTSGLVESLELIAGAVLGKGSHILMEEPGHQVIRNVLTSKDLNCHPARIDEHGFNLEHVRDLEIQYGAAFLTPSRHFPLGMTLPLSRRLQLLSWAEEQEAYIIEDDFDGEFRYQGQPLPAMMSLDQSGKVIYVGSFSKVMFPGLRLGFMVVPMPLVDQVSQELKKTGQRAATIAQPVLEQFIYPVVALLRTSDCVNAGVKFHHWPE